MCVVTTQGADNEKTTHEYIQNHHMELRKKKFRRLDENKKYQQDGKFVFRY